MEGAEFGGAVFGDLRGAFAAPGAGALDQRLILIAAGVEVVGVGPGAGQLQGAALRGLQLGVVLLDQLG